MKAAVATDKTAVHAATREPFSLIPPSAQAKRIYVVADERLFRGSFISSMLETLKSLEKTSPRLELPKLVIIDEFSAGKSFATSLEERVPIPPTAEVIHDPALCQIFGPSDNTGGWARNWGFFLKKGREPHFVRVSSSCGAQAIASAAEEFDGVSSSLEEEHPFSSGNILEASSESAIIGSPAADGENLPLYLTSRGIDFVELDTSWLAQKDVDNLITVIPSLEGLYFGYASPKAALRLLEKKSPDDSIRYHRPERQEAVGLAFEPAGGAFTSRYTPQSFVAETSVGDFLTMFRSFNEELEKKIGVEIQKLKEHYRLRNDRFIPVPMMWGESPSRLAAELFPNPVNALILVLPVQGSSKSETETHILTSDTTIPVLNGYIKKALESLGRVHLLDTWVLSSLMGNVHCSTNVFRW